MAGLKGQRIPLSRRGELSDWQLYKRLLAYVIPYWYLFALSIVGFMVYSLGNVLLADLLQFLLDALNDAPDVHDGIVATASKWMFDPGDMSRQEYARIAVPVVTVLLALVRALGFFAGTYFMTSVARNLVHDLRCELFGKMLSAPTTYYEEAASGVLISKITYNVEQVTGAVTNALKIVLREGLTVIALLSYMIYLNWRLCLVFFAVAPFIALVVAVVGKHFRRYSRRIQSSMGDVTQVSNESISAFREVRMYGGQEQQRGRFEQASNYNRVESLKLAFADALSTPVIQTMLATALGVLVWFAMNPSILAGFSAGSLVAFLTAAGQLGKPIRQLSGVQSVLQRGLAASEDIFAQLDTEAELDRGQYQVPRARGALHFDQVSFTYPGGERPAVEDFSLTIEPGQTVALVGRSGSGKSTLVHLLTRFHEADSGNIALDGTSVQDYQLQNYRDQIGLVSQQVTLFQDTVANNIAYGTLATASQETILEASRAAYAHDFIMGLPRGYDTLLGEDGGGLSGGQRQRIAIARAVLKDAPVMILDEATSALDNESEFYIQEALEKIMARCTTLVIAHRLTTIESADLIVVMDQGRMVDAGSHVDLLAAGGLYAQLYNQEFNE